MNSWMDAAEQGMGEGVGGCVVDVSTLTHSVSDSHIWFHSHDDLTQLSVNFTHCTVCVKKNAYYF